MLACFACEFSTIHHVVRRWVSKKIIMKKGKKLNRSHSDYNCELQENVAYFSTSHSKQSSEGVCIKKEEEEEEEEAKESTSATDKALVQLEPFSPHLPSRKYLLEKKVNVGM